jgi:Xaa-Pro aminopeptidase
MKNKQCFSPEWFAAQKVDALYTVTSEQMQDPLLTKFTGISHTDFSFRFIQTPEKNVLMTSPLEVGTVKQTYDGNVKVVRSRKDVLHVMRKFFRNKKVGVNLNYMTAGQLNALKTNFSKTKFVDVSESLLKSREIKTRDELKKIREAVSITQNVIKKIPNIIKNNMSEIALAAEIDYAFAREGCSPAFTTIVAFGKNSTNIHHFNTHAKLQRGNNVLIDCGAKFEGYCSDLSRTFVYGNATAEQNEMYEKCTDAQRAAFEHIKPGAPAHDAFTIAEKTLGHKIPHALGHGIGLETHDAPGAIHAKAEWTFQPNMAIAVEPGFYGKKWGIRIEDDAIITRSTVERLSFAPKKLVEI